MLYSQPALIITLPGEQLFTRYQITLSPRKSPPENWILALFQAVVLTSCHVGERRQGQPFKDSLKIGESLPSLSRAREQSGGAASCSLCCAHVLTTGLSGHGAP